MYEVTIANLLIAAAMFVAIGGILGYFFGWTKGIEERDEGKRTHSPRRPPAGKSGGSDANRSWKKKRRY